MHQKIVITGGPGTGKSTVITALQRMKYTCMTEVSRSVTRVAQREGIDQLFLQDPIIFSELLLKERINQYVVADGMDDGPVFFDRGIPDVMGYLRYLGIKYPVRFHEECLERRYNKVFMMPPWKKIYRTDSERYESYEQSLLIFERLKRTYTELGYTYDIIPEASVDNRVGFILDALEV